MSLRDAGMFLTGAAMSLMLLLTWEFVATVLSRLDHIEQFLTALSKAMGG